MIIAFIIASFCYDSSCTLGGKVYLACRSLESGNAAANDIREQLGLDEDRVVALQLNLSSFKAVRKFAQEFRASR